MRGQITTTPSIMKTSAPSPSLGGRLPQRGGGEKKSKNQPVRATILPKMNILSPLLFGHKKKAGSSKGRGAGFIDARRSVESKSKLSPLSVQSFLTPPAPKNWGSLPPNDSSLGQYLCQTLNSPKCLALTSQNRTFFERKREKILRIFIKRA